MTETNTKNLGLGKCKLVGKYIMVILTDLMKYSLHDNYEHAVGAKVLRYILRTRTEPMLNKHKALATIKTAVYK